MGIRFSVEKTFNVNGVEYRSIDEMPKEIREALQRAVQGSRAGVPDGIVRQEDTRILFNGNEYAREEEMPPQERELYRAVIKAIGNEQMQIPTGTPAIPAHLLAGTPIVPSSSFSTKKWIYGAAALILLLGVAYSLFLSGS